MPGFVGNGFTPGSGACDIGAGAVVQGSGSYLQIPQRKVAALLGSGSLGSLGTGNLGSKSGNGVGKVLFVAGAHYTGVFIGGRCNVYYLLYNGLFFILL